MIISESKKFVFFHTPKTGGSSMTAALAPYSIKGSYNPAPEGSHAWQCGYHYSPMHATVAKSWERCPNPKCENYFWFAFVRNPFDLVVSAWRMRQAIYANPIGVHKKRMERRGLKPIDAISLEQFLDFELGEPEFLHTRWTQSHHLVHGAPRELDMIGRYETLKEDWGRITDRLRIQVNLPHRNASNRERGWRQYYDEASKKRIADFYAEDLERWGYSY